MVSINLETPILIDLTINNQPENAIKSSNDVVLSNHWKSTNSMAMEKMRLINFCNRWVKYNVNTFPIALNTKRVTKHSFGYVKTVKINSLLIYQRL